MKILLTTGIYPPDIGGPAQYALNLAREFRNLGYEVSVAKFSDVKSWPTGIRHLVFFLKILPLACRAECCLALDTFSVAVPTFFAAKIFRRKIIIRAGGDFLWERYVEETDNLVTLPEFYESRIQSQLDWRDRLLKRLIGWTLRQADVLVFNSAWLFELWRQLYGLDGQKTAIIENHWGEPEKSVDPPRKNFVFTGRQIKLKNEDLFNRAFALAQKTNPTISLDKVRTTPERLSQILSDCYAVIIPSLTEVNPNLVAEAWRFGKPCLVTKFNGLNESVKSGVLSIDPRDEQDIAEKIVWLADDRNYLSVQAKMKLIYRQNPWAEIAAEFVKLFYKI